MRFVDIVCWCNFCLWDKKKQWVHSWCINFYLFNVLPGSICCLVWSHACSLRWRHNGRDSVSNHQPRHCLLSLLFRRRSKKTSKLRVTGLCAGISPGTGEFPAHVATNAENVSIWWRHHVLIWRVLLIARPPHEPQPSYPAILANNRRKTSNFESVPLLTKNINMSIVYLFYKVFTVLKVKVVLINCSWSKAPSKTA